MAGTSEATPPWGGPHLSGATALRDGAPPLQDGVADGRPAAGVAPPGGAAAWLNRLGPTARAYEPLWRFRSMGLLTGGAFSTERELATLLGWLGPVEGRDALDVGCSAGLYARTLAAAGARVHALDASRAFLLEARRRAEADGVALTLVQGDAHALPYGAATFDLVALGATLNELAEPERALGEIGRVLRPGGRAWFMFVARAGRFGRPLQALLGLGGLRFPDPAALDGWAAAAGLVPIRSERRGPLVLALYGREEGAPPVAESSPAVGWEGPTPRRLRRHNWERHPGEGPHQGEGLEGPQSSAR